MKKYYIYRITNLIDGKTYIGQHRYKELNDSYKGSGKLLLEAYKKYGIENFKKDILVFNISKKAHIDLLEKQFIAYEREHNKNGCYNIAVGGQYGGYFGKCHTKEWIENHSGENNAFYGKHHSEYSRKKMSESHKGKKPWNTGKLWSDETKQKISEALKGMKHSEDYNKKMSEIMTGMKYFNNGEINVRRFECPEGFVPGRLTKKSNKGIL